MITNTQDNLNNSLKRNILLEHELESERLNTSMMKIELETLNQKMNMPDKNTVESDAHILVNDREFLTEKINKLQVYKFIHLCKHRIYAYLYLVGTDID